MVDIFTSRCFIGNVRIVRKPFSIRGKKNILFGKNFTAGVGIRLEAFSSKNSKHSLHIGDDVQVNDYVHIAACENVVIGNNVLIASRVFISDHDHGVYDGDGIHDSPDSCPNNRELSYSSVLISDNVWIGENVTILKGVTIGKGAIIGANSVVTKDIGGSSIAVGSPARIIKKYDFSSKRWVKVN